MVYTLRQGLVGGGHRIKTVIDSDRNLDIDELRIVSESNIQPAFVYTGSTSGYASGGRQNFSVWMTRIDKFPFSSDTSASNVGDLSEERDAAGQSSTVNGYSAGGSHPPSFQNYVNFIDKFPFSIFGGTATDVGDLTVARSGHAGQSSGSNGYVTGGSPYTDVIDKFPVTSDAGAADIGNLTVPRSSVSGQSSTTHGYTSGSLASPTSSNIIDKFSFAFDGDATDVGDLIKPIMYGSASTGQSSTSHGYHSGGISTPPYIAENTIQKFTFASDNDATDVGNLTIARQSVTGQSSTTHGYAVGGYINPPQVFYNIIEKFTFASDNDATDVGDLTVEGFGNAGQQV